MFATARPWPRQLLVFGVFGALLTLFVAASAVFTLSGTVQTGHQLGQLSRAQRLHQDADMMHDALRADVNNAAAAGRGASTQTDGQILRATTSHAAQFRRDLNGLQQTRELPADVRAMLAASRPAREAYIALAERLVRSTLRDGSVDRVRARQFQERFQALVTPQSTLTGELAQVSTTLEREQAAREQMVSRVLVLASAAALAGWAFLILMLRRAGMRLFAALNREAEQRAVADQLQRSLLPERLPVIPGLQLAARSKPVNSGRHVGGDWYDVISLPSGDVGLVVGDVVGHDLRAATAMGQLRAALRAFAVYEPSPAAVLGRVNRVADLLDVTDLTTCVYAVVNPVTRAVRWSSAGHPNPLVVQAAGPGQLLKGEPGPPIGVTKGARYVDRTCRIQRRGLLMLFTDGLVERRSTSITDGLDRLEAIPGPHPDPDGLCDEVLSVLLADGVEPADDVTILALQA